MKYKELEEFFGFLIKKFGYDVFSDSKKCLAITSDMLECKKQEEFLLKTAFNNKVYETLLKAKDSTSENKLISIEKAVKILTDNCSIDLEKATNVVGLLANKIYPKEWVTFIRKTNEFIESQTPITPAINNTPPNSIANKGIAFAFIIILSLLINNVVSNKQIKEPPKNELEIKAKEEARIAAEKENKEKAEKERKAKIEAELKAKEEARINAEKEAKEKTERERKAKIEAELKAKEEARIAAEKEAKEKAEKEQKAKIEAELKSKEENRIATEKQSSEIVINSEQKKTENTNIVSSDNQKNIIMTEEKKFLVEAFKILGYENENFSVKNLPNKYKDMSESIAWTYNPNYSKPDRMNFLIQYFINELNYKGTISAKYKEIEPLDRKINNFNDYVLLSNSDETDIFGFAMSTGISVDKGEICRKDVSKYFLVQLQNNNFMIVDTKYEGLGNRTKTIYLQRNNDLFRYAIITVSPLEGFGNTVFGYDISVALSNKDLD